MQTGISSRNHVQDAGSDPKGNGNFTGGGKDMYPTALGLVFVPAGCKQEHTAGATHCGNVGCCHQLSSNLFRLITTLTAEVATTKLRGIIHRDDRIRSKKLKIMHV